MGRRREQSCISVVRKKRLHWGIPFGTEYRATAVQQTSTGPQQRPQGAQQPGLQGGQRGDVGRAAQPAKAGGAPHGAGGAGGGEEKNGIERGAAAMRLPPVLRPGGVGHQNLG